jgi:hypothetical protein
MRTPVNCQASNVLLSFGSFCCSSHKQWAFEYILHKFITNQSLHNQTQFDSVVCTHNNVQSVGANYQRKNCHHLHTSITLENIFLATDLEPDKWMHGWGLQFSSDSSIIYLTGVSAFSNVLSWVSTAPT